ncbi:MAG TPA: universal stress protein [Bacillota bacterium]|nr:universal stress protein [Bacillota bacterium]
MKKIKGRMDESILVCTFYGPNGERLINRGHKLATILDCPLYILTVDPLPFDKFDEEKSSYVERWKELADELEVEDFILKDNEKRPAAKVIAETAHDLNITQIIIGQTPQNRWEEITKGSFANALLKEITFIDVHIVSVDRRIKSQKDTTFEKGILGYLQKSDDAYRLSFTSSPANHYEGIFYKEIGTDFNNGIFKFVIDGKTYQVHIHDDKVIDPIKSPPNVNK